MQINQKILLYSLRNILAAGLYIFGVSQVLSHGNQLFGEVDNRTLAPFAFLLLFVLSAAVVGSLIFGQAIYYFFDKRKKESLEMAFYSIGWLFVLTIIVLTLLVLLRH